MQANQDSYLLDISNQFVSIMKPYQSSKDWQVKKDDGLLKVWEKQVQERIVVKSQIKVSLPFEAVVGFFSDPKFMKNISDNMTSFQLLRSSISQCPAGPISNREIFAVHTAKIQGNRAICGNRSCKYPFNKDPDSVLAEAYAAGFIVDKIDAKTTLLTHLNDVDVKGSIPNFIKNSIASKNADVLLTLEQKIRSSQK